MQNIRDLRVYCTLISVFMLLLILCSLLVAPAIGTTEATFDTVGDALIVKEQSGKEWTQLEQLNIFNQASAGDRILSPSCSGRYTFTIENSVRFPFIYTITVQDENLANIPMMFRLCDREGNYIIGSEAEWVTISAFNNISGTLAHQSPAQYTLNWMWLGTDDAADTASGILAQEDTVYALNFSIHTELSDDAVDPDGPAQTNDPAALSLSISLMLVSLVILTVLLIPHTVDRRGQL